MKVKVLTRNPDVYMRETKKDIHKVPRNFEPSLHPFQEQREYTRALNAVKLERVFAKPFLGSLDGHSDGISSLAKHPNRLALFASAAFDGEVRVWNMTTKRCLRRIQGHDGYVRGVSFNSDGDHIISIADDKTIKTWNTDISDTDQSDLPINTILSKTILSGLSCQRGSRVFATCGEVCQLWDESRSEALVSFKWGPDSLHHVAFNPIETSILASCGSDRSIILYDSREAGAVRKVTMEMKTNQLCWNPMEAYTFTAANEDYNLYTFDTRFLSCAANVHKDHVSAVISVDYSPTGLEFVTGSYDKTVRIYNSDKSHSREVYHTKRMQRVTSVLWSLDSKYVLSASDEMSIRLWKAQASEKLGVLKPRERAAFKYSEALKKKFECFPQVRRIARHRQIPRHVFHSQEQLRTSRNKEKRKEANRRAHSKPGSVPFVPERKKHIVKEDQ